MLKGKNIKNPNVNASQLQILIMHGVNLDILIQKKVRKKKLVDHLCCCK